MQTVATLPEIVVYSMLNFLPFLFLAMIPFREKLRFSKTVTNVIIGAFCFVQVGLGIVAAYEIVNTAILSVISTVLYAMVYFALIKTRFGRMIFTFLVLCNIANVSVILAKGLEAILFGGMALVRYRWTLSVCLCILHLLVSLPLYFYVRSIYTRAADAKTPIWGVLWVLPITFYVIWFYHLYMSGGSAEMMAMDPKNAFFLLVINLGSAVVYHLSVVLLLEIEKTRELSDKNHHLSMQKLQYDNLQTRINEARQAKHDVRHHTHLIREYLRSGKLQELESYLDNYTASLPNTQALVYSKHDAVNVLLAYFAQQAQEAGIEMDVFVQLPESLNLPDTTLSVILGNLLENAMEACRQLPAGEGKITVRGKAEGGSVFFDISNTYSGQLRKNKAGKILSSKGASRGLGLESVSQLASTHNGMLEVDATDGIFKASVLLMEN